MRPESTRAGAPGENRAPRRETSVDPRPGRSHTGAADPRMRRDLGRRLDHLAGPIVNGSRPSRARRAVLAPWPGRRRTVAHDPRTLRLRPTAGPRRRPPDPVRARRRGQAALRRLQPPAAAQAAPGPAGPPRRPPRRGRPRRHRPARLLHDRRAGDPPPDPRERGARRGLADRPRRGRRDRRPAGPQLGDDRRLVRPCRPQLRLAGRPARRPRQPRLPERLRRAGDRRPGLLRRHVPDRDRADRGPDRGPDPVAGGGTGSAYRKLERRAGDFATVGVGAVLGSRPTATSARPASA